MPGRRWDFSRLVSRAVQLALLAAWIALVVWKVLTFLSEPTASQTRFENDFHKPYLTVCPKLLMGRPARDVLSRGSFEEQLEYFGNGTLQDVFRREGMKLLDMMPHLAVYTDYKADPSMQNYSDHNGYWTTGINYAWGGLCGTLEVTKELPYLQLYARRHFQHRWRYCFDSDGSTICTFISSTIFNVHVHRQQEDFWGAEDKSLTPISDAEMATFEIIESTTSEEIVITVEREIMPNMRRRPCVEDPSYSRSMCWRKCFFDSLNCSVLKEGDRTNDNKPDCRAIDISWYQRAFMDFTVTAEFDESDSIRHYKYPCSCPRPCVMDRYSMFVRSSFMTTTVSGIKLKLSFTPVMRIIETTVTYDLIDLMADIGGFLGLFVGYSILSVFDDIKALAMRILKTRTSKVTGSSKDNRQDLVKTYNVTGTESTEPATGVIRAKISRAWADQKHPITLSY